MPRKARLQISASCRADNPDGTPTNVVRTDSFHYDALGNRTGWNEVASRGAMLFQGKNNGLNQYFSWENSYPEPPQHWGTTTNYDDDVGQGWGAPGAANGVLMQDGWITAGYNALNQPIQIWSPFYQNTSNWMWFGFDPLGRCVKRWVGPSGDPNTTTAATYFYYDGSDLIQEGPSAALVDRTYVHGGRVDEIVASRVNGAWYHHLYDAQGNCIIQSGDNGRIQVQYDYDAFGFPYAYNTDGGKGNAQTRFLFTGREWISDLRLYDYRARLYQPELGRFLQPDPQEFSAGDYNLYRYCHNDPVNKSDPTGLREQIAGDIIRDRIWDMACRGDSGNSFQGSLGDFNNRLYHHDGEGGGSGGGQFRNNGAQNTFPEFRSAREAANSRINKIGVEITASKATEWVSEVGQAVDKSGHNVPNRYITNEPHRGRGAGDVKTNWFTGKAQNSLVNQDHLPQGYRVVGFVLGHVYKDATFAQRDLNAAKAANYQVAIIVSPKRSLESFYPIDVYER